MLPEAIFDHYLLYATESDRILKSYSSLVSQLDSKYLKLELVYLHKNICFIFKKLVSVLCNEKLWSNVTDNCLRIDYQPSDELRVKEEVAFLKRYKVQIIEQLKCIHNTTVFETDVLFLEKCFNMLNAAYKKVELRYGHVVSRPQLYLIAS
ncbi:hypothetical protein [Mucilaginibacter lacusdianchii]|uniref:hypothetical protein n=1 Tax=Mucilaginibacter lacusdianchii TaxID=2684211 RepID=UPI00131AA408|nr:hypothetical protein [Mucilaginibacter sp. JXJ CY 39]